MRVVECVGALSFLCIYQPESVLNGFMNGFLGCVCVSCLCVQTARISFHIDRYNQLLLNFSSSAFLPLSSQAQFAHFSLLEQSLLPGNITVLSTLHQKVMVSAKALVNIAALGKHKQ